MTTSDSFWMKDGRAWWCHCKTHTELSAAAEARARQMSAKADGRLYLKLVKHDERPADDFNE